MQSGDADDADDADDAEEWLKASAGQSRQKDVGE